MHNLLHSVDATLTWWRAATLGVVEGATEFLPVSSTGHLLIASRLLGLPHQKGSAGLDALNTYVIAIQFGAILAVAGLFWRRLKEMGLGLFGRSESGRHLLATVIIAFFPAAVLGLAFDKHIESALFGPWPVIVAWVAGGLLTVAFRASRREDHPPTLERVSMHQGSPVGPPSDYRAATQNVTVTRADGPAHLRTSAVAADPLASISYRTAALIGLGQCLALWPGTSRSLATILTALVLGVSMEAAVEFSFLLGFLTLGAATAFKLLQDGGTLVDQFGVANPAIGAIVAFASAVAAIRWMIGYLKKHDLTIFAWYRFGAAALAVGLIAFKVI